MLSLLICTCGRQAALYVVLKESFKLYKALSEGLINLADCFFEMDHAAAAKGLDAYREAIAGSNRLQARPAFVFAGCYL